jgi:hypothetical protein
LRLANVALDSVKIISQPQSGQVALLGWGFSYSSTAGIGEKDSFTLALVGKVDKKPGGSTIEVAVSIVGPSRALPSPRPKSPPAQRPIAPTPPQPLIENPPAMPHLGLVKGGTAADAVAVRPVQAVLSPIAI